jgi:hypothetical protein
MVRLQGVLAPESHRADPKAMPFNEMSSIVDASPYAAVVDLGDNLAVDFSGNRVNALAS